MLDEGHCLPDKPLKVDTNLQQIGGFLWDLRFPPPIKLTAMI